MSKVNLSYYLVGGWRLLSWQIEYSDGQITYPFGDDANGQILYTADGSMSATVSADNRKPLSNSNVRNVPDTEQAAAFRSYFHYAGYWRIDGADVIHDVELGLNPGFPGTQQVRRVEIVDANIMILSAHEDLADGRKRKHALQWQRNEQDSAISTAATEH